MCAYVKYQTLILASKQVHPKGRYKLEEDTFLQPFYLIWQKLLVQWRSAADG